MSRTRLWESKSSIKIQPRVPLKFYDKILVFCTSLLLCASINLSIALIDLPKLLTPRFIFIMSKKSFVKKKIYYQQWKINNWSIIIGSNRSYRSRIYEYTNSIDSFLTVVELLRNIVKKNRKSYELDADIDKKQMIATLFWSILCEIKVHNKNINPFFY